MPNFPTSLDTLSNPTSTTLRNDPGYELDVVISTLNDIVEALEAKVGVTASTAVTDSVLTGTSAGSTAWQRLDNARAWHNADQSIANTTVTIVALNVDVFDNNSIHDPSTNNSRLTCKVAGKYLITAGVQFSPNSTGQRRVAIMRNGSQTTARTWVDATGGGQPTDISISTLYALSVNDYVEIEVYQDSGGAINVSSVSPYTPELSMVRVAP